jgi:serine/threonine protein kinase
VDFDKTALPAIDDDGDALAPMADPNIGIVLQERYRIVRKLGEGGMGRVYEAEHILIKKRVAIKCLHAQYANNGEVIARFQREAQAASAIGNEHIVEVTDLGRFPDGSVFMALEFLDGRDLATDIEQNGALTLGRATRIMTQVCEALAAAHEKGIVHRDLKPENIFLVRRKGNPDFVKIVDFGISKFKDSDGRGMTATGAMIGTPHYMAPEQIEGRRDIDHRVDLYAMGVILFVMLTDRMPFDASTLPKLVYEVCSVRPPSIAEYREDISPEFQAIIAKLLEKDPADRFAQCEELAAALEPFLSTETPAGNITGARAATPSGIRPTDQAASAEARAVTSQPSGIRPNEQAADLQRSSVSVGPKAAASAAAITVVPPMRPRAAWKMVVGGLLLVAAAGIAAVVSRPGVSPADSATRPSPVRPAEAPRARPTPVTPTPVLDAPVQAVAAPPAPDQAAPAAAERPLAAPSAAPAVATAPTPAVEVSATGRARSRRRRGPSHPAGSTHVGSHPSPGGAEIAPIL